MMKLTNKKGFTLIELILVIVILGILAAVAIPKFSALQTVAVEKTEDAVVGQLRAGLTSYAAAALINSGNWDYPADDSYDLLSLMDEIPDSWTYVTSTGVLSHLRDDGTTETWTYIETAEGTGGTRGSYTLE